MGNCPQTLPQVLIPEKLYSKWVCLLFFCVLTTSKVIRKRTDLDSVCTHGDFIVLPHIDHAGFIVLPHRDHAANTIT